jgi:hypothetical protein
VTPTPETFNDRRALRTAPEDESMTAIEFETASPEMDSLLGGIGRSLELTPEQRQRARIEFDNLREWLANSVHGAAVSRELYEQGSSRIGTEVRPLSDAGGDACEHDLDAVAEHHQSSLGPMEQYEAMHKRLAENPRYKPNLVRKNRCIRIDFRGNFHLDVVPAQPDRASPGTTKIIVPDRLKKQWTHSNPKGFARWFELRGQAAREEFEKSVRQEAWLRGQTVVPHVPTFAEKPVLNRAIQLLKRRRDMVFMGSENAPRSIVLTTLAARSYDGGLSVYSALQTIVASIVEQIDRAHPHRVEVRNPTDGEENFADKWRGDDAAYAKFTDFIRQFAGEIFALRNITGLENVVEALERLFGAEPVQKSYREFSEDFRQAADDGRLRVGNKTGLITVTTGASMIVPRSTHYGA